MRRIPQSATARRTGQTSITTAAIPVTRVGSPSGAGTTFTVTTGIDAAAWDLSAVIVGDVAITSDNCIGMITDINDGTDTITVAGGWSCEATGYRRNTRVAASVPADGSTITIYRITHAKKMRLKASPDNTADIFIGKHGAVTTGDYGLGAGEHVDLEPEAPHDFIDLSQVYAIAASGTQVVEYIPGVEA